MAEATARSVPPVSPVSGQYVFAEFRIDLFSRQLYRENVHVPITAKAFETLIALVRRQGQLVTKDELISEVWPDTFVSEDSLTQNISALRRILEDDAAQPRFIATVARRGYRFVAPVTTEVRSPAGPASAPMEPVPAQERPPQAIAHPITRGGRRVSPVVGWMTIAALVGLGVGIGIARRFPRPPQQGSSQLLRFVLDLPSDTALASGGTVSPDGRHIAFIARDDRTGDTKLWIRTLATGVARPIAGSEGALRPFWSPDGQSIAFFGGSHLRRSSLTGGAPSTVCDTIQPRPSGGSWNERDEILFSDFDGLYLVSARGGAAKKVLSPSPERKEAVLGWPQFLPYSRRFMYEVRSTEAATPDSVFARSLDGGDPVKLADVTGDQIAYAGGSLVYVRDRQLMARRFDPATFAFDGDPVVVVDDVPRDAPVSASTDAVIAYGGAAAEQLAWFDRTGRALGTINFPEPLRNLALSPDQQTLLAESVAPRRRALWLIDLTRDIPTRFADGTYPVWSPDGKSVVFSAARAAGGIGIYSRSIDGTSDELLTATSTMPILNDFTRDGRYLVYVLNASLTTKEDIWLLPRDQSAKPVLLLGSPAKELHAQVSPDGHWIAYASDEEGTFQVYLQAFPQLGSKRRVSPNGGAQPQWRGDGAELFYLSADQTLMSVSVTPGSRLRLGTPRSLFRTQPLGLMTDFRDQYTVSADGKRFIVGTASSSGSRELITVLVNWRPTGN
jgi:DNA-binding winged helix-turn-helix (wHTH) protein/Tol biopolymer transport system component